MAAASISQPLVAPRLSIVVLPFANFSSDSDQQYFADGMTDDLTTDLSRLPDMLVISRNTAFTYRNKPVDTKQIGRELGVRYVLEGSVQRSGSQVRINAQLIDAETDAHLWAERFERDTRDLFALQDEITSRIAIALGLDLTIAEAARPTEHPDAVEYILRGARCEAFSRNIQRSRHSVGTCASARPAFRRGTEQLGVGTRGSGAAQYVGLTGCRSRTREGTERKEALAASPAQRVAHFAKGEVLRAQHRYAEAIPEYETVLALDRNWVYAFFALGQCKLFRRGR